MDFKNINIDMDGMHRDDNRGIFVYTPAVGMEVKIVISSLCKISKSINGHTIETDINDVIIRIDKKSDDKKVYQNYLETISRRHKSDRVSSAKYPFKTSDNSHNIE